MLMLGADSWLKLPDQVVIPILLYKEDMTHNILSQGVHILPFIHMQLHIVMAFT